MPTLRRPHRKSRGGCKECKRRKIKCDETRPSCFNCTRYSVQCNYAADKSKQDGIWSPPAQSSNSPPLDLSSEGFQQTRDQSSPGFSPFDSPSITQLGQSWGRDLELMHHYCTVTSNTMACQESARHVWRVVFPQMGYVHEFVMHGILSLAALHKAYLIPDKRNVYLTLSSFHHSIGQQTFTSLLPDVNCSNWQPVFCFATIIIAYVMTLSTQPSCHSQPETTPISRVLELFSVTKGIRSILLPFIPQLNDTRLAPLVTSVWLLSIDGALDPKPSLEQSVLPGDTFNALSCLRHVLCEHTPAYKKADYEKAVATLEISAVQTVCADVNVEVGAVLLWPFFLPDSIIADTRERKPLALVILSYYAVYIHTLDKSYWFLRDWGRRLLNDIEKHIGDAELFRELLEWPRRHIDGKA
ncbi:unnamed protein product [Clonostachys byssicola]|uniref:Zn(2)-C6 fungal-type domain-containing protein n=1 Tax=Clonostachys byssicola TaxID=160290 RepID=A0A9N9Y6U9_9HYPO|nr:unnamed protein product [Clonostachys byssicola]